MIIKLVGILWPLESSYWNIWFLLKRNTYVYTSIFLSQQFSFGLPLIGKMKLFYRMPFFHCLQLQWLCLHFPSEGIWVFFPLPLQDMLPLSWNLLYKWDLREHLVPQSFSDHSQKSLTHWKWKIPLYVIGWTYWLSCLLGWNLMVYFQQRW